MSFSRIITALPPLMARNGFSGQVGYRFRAVRNITATAFGRPIGSIFNQTHPLRLWPDTSGPILASVSVGPSSPSENGWAYAMLATPVSLTAGTSYLLMSEEFAGGDNWQDAGAVPDAMPPASVADIDSITSRWWPDNTWPGNLGPFGAYVWPTLYEGFPFNRRRNHAFIGVAF